jgi:hypothetical protein
VGIMPALLTKTNENGEFVLYFKFSKLVNTFKLNIYIEDEARKSCKKINLMINNGLNETLTDLILG